ncbi:glycine/D-amino acid oxidase-like deaminating enzyme [Algoriphagus iocasae]|uniref:Glycine/D-amino acid oxidase-like deaminating enzyme n=1 Tax=Algoriphagus iocasae TaxID=1836499 RepID=A0A841MS50_9BACT|nr:FAD-dependent oxidoreductase [Algoriphagus iocasae]MBB6324861.1 glycine/D-amino acid oxidase-like deaminating enzyme [Algoriphagus iocasae]
MEIDFLLIGQGIAGSALGFRLKQAGKKIRIIDQPSGNQSSRVAAGLYNPVTGRKMVKTWNADLLFPEIKTFYQELEKITGQSFLVEEAIYRPFLSIEEQNEWMGNSAESGFQLYLENIFKESQSEHLKDPFGGVLLKQSGWLKINSFLDSMQEYFSEELIQDYFNEKELAYDGEFWKYKELKSKAIIYCNGLGAMDSRFFGFLPFAPVKGEILEVRQAFYPDYIVNRGVFRVHLGNGIHRVGSTYTKHDLHLGPTEEAKMEILDKLKDLVKMPVEEIISHKTGIRPATRDRKPFLGKHPEAQSVYIFDGFGAKGVSLVPYFSKIMAAYLLGEDTIPKEVDIARYFNYI